jgi:hypothetical protein
MVLPFVTVSSIQTNRLFERTLQLDDLDLSNKLLEAHPAFVDTVLTFFKNEILWLSFSLIAGVVFLSLFLFKLYKLKQLVKKNRSIVQEDFTVIELRNSVNAFSFLNYIFLGNLIPSADKEMIMAHEKVHVLDKHSFDLILFEVLKVVLWFNPMLYLFQKRLKEVHEFIADSKATTTSKKAYTNILINQLFQTKHLSFINSFYNKSLTQKRLIMLSKSKSKQRNIAKYLLLIPILLLMVIYNSCSSHEDDQLVKEVTQVELIKEDYVSFKDVDKAPVFPDCLSNDTKDCFSKSINSLVARNFNMELAEELDLKGTLRIITMFKIDSNGSIQEVKARAPHPKLEEEIIRVINLIPYLKPAKFKGKPVTVAYSLPIKFKIN